MERLRSTKKLKCSDDSAQELYQSMNARPDVVVVKRDAVDDCVLCHQRLTGRTPRESLPSLEVRGPKYYTVNRMELFHFMNRHGKVCP